MGEEDENHHMDYGDFYWIRLAILFEEFVMCGLLSDKRVDFCADSKPLIFFSKKSEEYLKMI